MTLLVVGLGATWIATSRMGSARARGAAPPRYAGAPTATSTSTVVARSDSGIEALRRLLPADARCDGEPRPGAQARCSVGGVDVDYRLLSSDAALAAYRSAIGPRSTGTGTALTPTSPACARGAEEERAWSRPASPRLGVGRYACRIEHARAAMWWTVGDRGLLVHAVAGNDDLAALFAWWESHSER